VILPLELFVVAGGNISNSFSVGAAVGLDIRLEELGGYERVVETQLTDRLREYYGLYVGTFRRYLVELGDASADDRLEAAWMLLLSVHRISSMAGAGCVDAVVDESLLDLLRIAIDVTSSGAIYSLNQTASLTSDDVRKVERSVRSMAAQSSRMHKSSDVYTSPVPAVLDSASYWFVRWLMVLCLPSTAELHRRTSRKRLRREDVQADDGPIDVFAEDGTSGTSAAGTLRGPCPIGSQCQWSYPFVGLFHRTVVEQCLTSAVLIVCCERVPTNGSSRDCGLQCLLAPAYRKRPESELLRATLLLLPPSVALVESEGRIGGGRLSVCLQSSLLRLLGQRVSIVHRMHRSHHMV